jgi:hypothetical protein
MDAEGTGITREALYAMWKNMTGGALRPSFCVVNEAVAFAAGLPLGSAQPWGVVERRMSYIWGLKDDRSRLT